MDEPTAALSPVEAKRLFDVVETLRAEGAAVVFISHRLEEVFAICQRVTVLRDGKLIFSKPLEGLTPDDLVRAMVGRDVQAGDARGPQARRRRCSRSSTSPARACSSTSPSRSAPARWSRWPGSSARGAARSPAPSSASTATTRARSTVKGRALRRGSPTAAMDAGIGFVPEDRRQHGLVMEMSTAHNIALASLGRLRAARPDLRRAPSARSPPTGPSGSRSSTGGSRARSRCSRAATSRRSCWPSGWPASRRC